MTREQFVNALSVMCDALPTPQQERRVSALYEFFGERDFDRVSRSAHLAAKEADRFPTPAAFEEFFRRTLRKEEPQGAVRWTPKAPMTDQEVVDQIMQMGPQKCYRGLLALGATKSTVPFLKRLKTLTLEILGEDESQRIQIEAAKAALDLRILDKPEHREAM